MTTTGDHPARGPNTVTTIEHVYAIDTARGEPMWDFDALDTGQLAAWRRQSRESRNTNKFTLAGAAVG